MTFGTHCNTPYLKYSALPGPWKSALGRGPKKEYLQNTDKFLRNEIGQKKVIYPKREDIFRAFELTSFDNIKVVIIGQDPYHGEGQAHGLCFSVNKGVKVPPSLRNIYKELLADEQISEVPTSGDLTSWAKNGVLLINNVLTVEEKKPASHKKCGWEAFTDHIVDVINEKQENIVFLLWGSHAQSKGKNIDRSKHFILESTHPSPLSAYRGFLGCRHFSKANEYLREHNKGIVDWSL